MDRLIKFSVSHPVSVLMYLFIILTAGAVSAFFIPVDFYPPVQERNLIITTEYEGFNAEQIRTLITMPVEDAVSSLKGLKNIDSVSRDNISIITAEFHWGTDMEMALLEAKEILDIKYPSLPDKCSKPEVKLQPFDEDFFTISIIPKGKISDIFSITKNELKSRFQQIEGIAEIKTDGGTEEEIVIETDREKLESKGLTIEQVGNIVDCTNIEYPAGTITVADKEIMIKTDSLYKTPEDILETPVKTSFNSVLRIKDIGQLKIMPQKQTHSIFFNGNECMKISISKKKNVNPLKLSRRLKNEINSMKNDYKNMMDIQVIKDSSEELSLSLILLTVSAAAGMVISFLILFFFFRNLSDCFCVISVVPCTVIFIISILKTSGKSINSISLTGIAICIGMISDSAAITVENIKRNLSATKGGKTAGIENYSRIIIEATSEIKLSNLGSSLTTIIVFLPVLFTEGYFGELFSDLAVPVLAGLAFSSLYSFSVIPACMEIIYSKKKARMESLKKMDIPCIEKIMKLAEGNSVTKSMIFSAVSLIITACLFTICRKELTQQTRSSYISFSFNAGENLSLKQKNEIAAGLCARILENNGIEYVEIKTGLNPSDSAELADAGNSDGKIECLIKKKKGKIKNNDAFLKDLCNEKLKSGKTDLLQKILGIDDSSYIVTAEGNDSLKIKIQEYASGESDITPYNYTFQKDFSLDRQKAVFYAINPADIFTSLGFATDGYLCSPFYKSGKEIPIRIRMDRKNTDTMEALEELKISGNNSGVPLKALGHFYNKNEENILFRHNRNDAKKITFPVKTTGLISRKQESIQEFQHTSFILIIFVVLLIICVLGAQFESLRLCFLFSLPFPAAMTGALLFTIISGHYLNLNTIIGIAVLAGLSVNNAIILYEAALHTRSNDIFAAFKEKTGIIMLTSMTSVFSLVPFAVDPLKINAQSSLAVTLSGGLFFSLLFTLVFTPVPIAEFIKKSAHKNIVRKTDS